MAKRSKQLEFKIKDFNKPNDCFGGSLLKGNAKRARPLDSKLPILITLRATKGGMRTPKAFKKVNDAVYDTAHKYGFKIYKYSNVGNHLHLVLKLSKLQLWAAFIRELTGKIGLLMKLLTKAEGKFWMYRPHTRIVRGWKKAFRIALDYVGLNQLEAEGFISRKVTKSLKDLRALWGDG